VRGSSAGADVLHVDDGVLEVLVEDARLDLEGCLGVFKIVLQIEDALVGLRAEIKGIDEADSCSSERDDRGDADEVPDAQAGGAHGGDFRVGGETAEAE
jgi:hypothetical protein